jgi:hypothetical protein
LTGQKPVASLRTSVVASTAFDAEAGRPSHPREDKGVGAWHALARRCVTGEGGGLMLRDLLKIPKKLKPVTLWVHPEGRVVGSLFLRPQSPNAPREEEPIEVLNTPDPFLVLRRDDRDELRFYNKTAVVRVEYEDDAPQSIPDVQTLLCTLHLMDGSLISGIIRKALPPDRARLFDYLNLHGEHFVKVHCEDGMVCVVNKSYIACVTP